MDFQSNEEFMKSVGQLIDRWCEQRKLGALARILPGYLAFNGLTDGWEELFDALKFTRSLGHEMFRPEEWDQLNDLIHAADLALSRDR